MGQEAAIWYIAKAAVFSQHSRQADSRQQRSHHALTGGTGATIVYRSGYGRAYSKACNSATMGVCISICSVRLFSRSLVLRLASAVCGGVCRDTQITPTWHQCVYAVASAAELAADGDGGSGKVKQQRAGHQINKLATS